MRPLVVPSVAISLFLVASSGLAQSEAVLPAPHPNPVSTPVPPSVQPVARPLPNVPQPFHQPVYWGPPPAVSDEAASEEPERRWYGWQTLTVDAAAITLGIALAAENETAGVGVSMLIGGYLFGGPIVHGSHGAWGKAAASLGTRVAAPILGAVLAVAFTECSGELCSIGYAAVGGLVGAAGAIALDAAAYAYEPAPEPERPTLALSPIFVPATARRPPLLGAALSGSF
jgi:hypothetical protein